MSDDPAFPDPNQDVAFDEGARLAALRDLAVLDTPPEPGYDDMARVAATLCGTPIALVSLVDRDRQWFKAKVGLELAETPIGHAVCALAIRQRGLFMIGDLAADPRTAANPLVTAAGGIRFYAGAPLVTTDGLALGTLCVIDTAPRPDGLTPGQQEALMALGRHVALLLEARHLLAERDVAIRVERARARGSAALTAAQRAAQEAGGIGTFVLDVVSNEAQVSAEFCRLFGLPIAPTYPFELLEELILPAADPVHSTLTSRRDGSAMLDVEYRIRRAEDGRISWIARRARFDRAADGAILRMYGTIHDITERRLAAERMAALVTLGDRLRDATTIGEIAGIVSKTLGRTLEATRAGYATIDLAAGTYEVERCWTDGTLPDLSGTHRIGSGRTVATQLQGVETIAVSGLPAADAEGPFAGDPGAPAHIVVPLGLRGDLTDVLFVHHAAPRAWTDSELAFAQSVADRAYAAVAKMRAETDRQILTHELNHRLKNMMAMVQAIAAQTFRGVSERAPVLAFEQRLLALSSAHDMLLRQHGNTARIATVASGAIEALGQSARVDIGGANLLLGAKAALSLSLVLHELTTNAIKYGALSVEGGRVELSWRVTATGMAPELMLRWREHGGPPVTEPTRKGFGSRLISLGLLGTGGAAIRYHRLGLEAEFSASLARAQTD